MNDNDKLLDLEFDSDDYVPDRVLVEEEDIKPLEVNLGFEFDAEGEVEVETDANQVSEANLFLEQPIANTERESVEIKTPQLPQKAIEFEESNSDSGSALEAAKINANINNGLADIMLKASVTSDVISEITNPDANTSFQLEAVLDLNETKELMENAPASQDSAKIPEVELLEHDFKAMSQEVQVDPSEPEICVESEIVSNDSTEHQRKKLPIDLIAYVLLGIIVLVSINYFLFMTHEPPAAIVQPKLNQIVEQVKTKHLEEELIKKEISHINLENRIQGKNFSGAATLHIEDDLVKTFDLNVTVDQPEPLTPTQIVAGESSPVWLQKLEVKSLSLVQNQDQKFAGTGKARVYLEDQEVKKRILVLLSVKGVYNPKSKTAQIELAIQEGASHLNLNEIGNSQYHDNFWIKPFKDTYDLLFSTKFELSKQVSGDCANDRICSMN